MTISCYIAGPYSSEDPLTVEENVLRAMDAGDRLEDIGIRVFIPHLSHYRHARKPRSYEEWIKIDLFWLPKCDVLLRLPGPSKGSDGEVEAALRLGKPVYRSVEELIAVVVRDSTAAALEAWGLGEEKKP